MRRLLLAVLVPSLLVIASIAHATTGDDLLSGVPVPPDSKALGTQTLSSGGQQASYSTATSPSGVIASYKQALPTAGWTVTGGGGGGVSYGGGAGLQATNGPKYLSVNAGGPAGLTFVNVCVWPSKPGNDSCGEND